MSVHYIEDYRPNKTRAAAGHSSCRRPLHRAGDALVQCVGLLLLAFFMAVMLVGVFVW